MWGALLPLKGNIGDFYAWGERVWALIVSFEQLSLLYSTFVSALHSTSNQAGTRLSWGAEPLARPRHFLGRGVACLLRLLGLAASQVFRAKSLHDARRQVAIKQVQRGLGTCSFGLPMP